MKLHSKVATKRMLISIILGILFGVLCAFFASFGHQDMWGSALMWAIIFNRFLLGFMVGLAGFVLYQPCLGFRLYPFIRGTFIGILVSLEAAIGVFIAPEVTIANTEITACTVFWSTIIAGAIYGIIIDIVATKFAGEGEALAECMKK